MSERSFRAVVAMVLVGALVLAAVVVAVLLPHTAQPSPGPSPAASPTPSSSPDATPTSTAGPALATPEVVSVGLITLGSTSSRALVLRFVEVRADSILDGAGSFRVALADHLGDERTVAFVGTPSVDAPGYLGATATFVAPNVLLISLEHSDTGLLESITVKGLGIRANPAAATGSLGLHVSDFTGSLGGGVASDIASAPGTVVAGP